MKPTRHFRFLFIVACAGFLLCFSSISFAETILVYGDELLRSPLFKNAIASTQLSLEPLSAGELKRVGTGMGRALVLAPVAPCPPESRLAISRFLREGGSVFVVGAKAFDYRPVPENPVFLRRFFKRPKIIHPLREQPSVAALGLEGAQQTELSDPNGNPALRFHTETMGMDDTMVRFRAAKTRSAKRTVLTFSARGSNYAELLTLEIIDQDGGRWIHFVPVTGVWANYAVSLADFMPAGWSDAEIPYPLLDPAKIETIDIGINTLTVWREKPMAFSIGSVALAEDASGFYTPTSALLALRLPYREVGITAPTWIFDPFAGRVPMTSNITLISRKGFGKASTQTLAGLSSVWRCPPPYMEHPGTKMGTDCKRAYDTKKDRALRRIPLWEGISGSGVPEGVAAELRFFAAGDSLGAGVGLFGFDPPEFFKKQELVSSLLAGLDFTLFSPRILAVTPNTTKAEPREQARPTLDITVYNPTDRILRGTLHAEAGNGRVFGESPVDLPRRGKATRVLELSEVPADFPFTSFDWKVSYETGKGGDVLVESVDVERTLLRAFTHLLTLQQTHDDARFSHHYFGDAYGVRAMFLYLNWLERNPEHLRENADLWAGINPEAIEAAARRFVEMLLSRQDEEGFIPMGYGEHHNSSNIADGGQISLCLAQISSRINDAPLQSRIANFTRRFIDMTESFYIDKALSGRLTAEYPEQAEKNNTCAGHYGLGLVRGKRTLTGPWWVLPDIMGIQAFMASTDSSPVYRDIIERNTRFYLDAGYSAAGYFQAEALVWAYLTIPDDVVRNRIKERLQNSFFSTLVAGKENDFLQFGCRGTLRTLSLLYYRNIVGDSAGARAVLLKQIWGVGSESSNVSIRRQAEMYPRSRHGESLAAAKLSAYSAIWIMELLDPGCTLLPRYASVMQPSGNAE